MQTDTQGLLTLSDPGAVQRAVAGAKAATLSALSAQGYRVPDGFVVTVAACAAVAHLGRVADPLRAALKDALAPMAGGFVAVRSSAVAEDRPDASYAGQYLSVLDVPGEVDAVCDAIVRVVASAKSATVQAYRFETGQVDSQDVAMAVLVQRQVAADAAGVAFTADPVTGDRDRIVVHAACGLGDRLVTGHVTPQAWLVRDGVAEFSPGGEGEGVLTADQAIRVAELAGRISAAAGRPQDVEWATHGDDLWLLQARPITALPVPPIIDLPPGTWFKESGRRAELVTPFGASIALPLVSDGLATAFAELGLLLERIDMRSIGGEVYVRPVPLGGRRASSPPPWWLLGVLCRVVPPLRARCAAASSAVEPSGIETLVHEWQTRWRPDVVEATRKRQALDPATLRDAELADHLDDLVALLERGLTMHFRLLPPYVVAVHELAQTCQDLLGWNAGQTLELLAGCSTPTSEPARELAGVAALATEPATVRDALATPGGDVRERLRAVDEKVASAFDAWFERYAWRLLGEDPGAPTLAEQPAMLVGLLRDALSAEEDCRADVDERRSAAIERARFRLAGSTGAVRDRFEAALATASRVYPVREDSAIWAACYPGGLIRRALIEIGQRFAAAGLLTKADDVAMLDVHTVRAALPGADGRAGDLRTKAARARAELAWTAAHPGPRRYGPRPGPPPDLRGLPAAARRTNQAMVWADALQHPSEPPSAEVARSSDAPVMRGAAGSAGRYTGPARVVRHFDEFDRLRPGDVLVCPATDPSWSVLFARLGAIVTEGGGALSHAAIIAREHGVPAVLAVHAATRVLHDGQLVTVDGTAGTVRLADQESRAPQAL